MSSFVKDKESASHRVDVPNCPLWEWFAKSMLESNDWYVLDTILTSEGINTNCLQEA